MRLKDRLKKYLPRIVIGAVVAVAVIRLSRVNSGAIKTISPSPDDGIIIPYDMIHKLVERGTANGGVLLTIHENVDDVLDAEFILKFVGMRER